MSDIGDLLDGIDSVLTGAGLATDRADGSEYQVGETALVRAVMPEQPDRVICTSAYRPGADSPVHPWTRLVVRFRIRTGPDDRDGATLEAAIYNLMQGMRDRTFGDCTVGQVINRMSTQPRPDSSQRLERTADFAFDIDLPASANRAY